MGVFKVKRYYLVVGLLLVLATHARGEEWPDWQNRTTITSQGLTLTMAINKFEYQVDEAIWVFYGVENQSSFTVNVQGERTCMFVGKTETWCSDDGSSCVSDPLIEYCSPSGKLSFAPGERYSVRGVLIGPRQPVDSYAFKTGYVRFSDPWGSPSAFTVLLSYTLATPLAVEETTWSTVKSLYLR
jgi:hypothetical protein